MPDGKQVPEWVKWVAGMALTVGMSFGTSYMGAKIEIARQEQRLIALENELADEKEDRQDLEAVVAKNSAREAAVEAVKVQTATLTKGQERINDKLDKLLDRL